MKKTTKAAIAVISLAGLVSIANAATPGFYVGGGLGYSRMDTSDLTSEIKDQISPVGGTVSNSRALHGLGGRLFAGYSLNKYLGLEAGIAHYATEDYKVTVFGQTTKEEIEGNAIDVVGKVYLPINNSGFNVYALGGVAYLKQEAKASGVSESGKGLKPKYGIGASYDINPQLTASFEVSRVQGDNTALSKTKLFNSDMASLNLAYNFG